MYHFYSANWTKLANFMLVGFRDVDPNVRLQAVKILENYIKGESTSQLAADAGMCSTAAGGSTQETSIDPYMSNTVSGHIGATVLVGVEYVIDYCNW